VVEQHDEARARRDGVTRPCFAWATAHRFAVVILAVILTSCGTYSTHVLPLDQATNLSGKFREGRTRRVEDIHGRSIEIPPDFALRVYSKGQPEDSYQEFQGRLYIELTDEKLVIGAKGDDDVTFPVERIARVEVAIHPNDPRRRTTALWVTVAAVASVGVIVLIAFAVLPAGGPR
jgi:hypothetical protein